LASHVFRGLENVNTIGEIMQHFGDNPVEFGVILFNCVGDFLIYFADD